MTTAPIRELQIPYQPTGTDKPGFTYTKVVGDLSTRKKLPLIVLHGGPGSTHDYVLPLSALASSDTPVVFYDQFGAGRSTLLPERMGDTDFWTEDLFVKEFFNVLDYLKIEEYDLLGHSWGGMLASRIATGQPKGLNRLILADAPASIERFMKTANALKKYLPQDVQDVLQKHEDAGTTESKEYEDAVNVYNAHFLCRADPMPEEMLASFKFMGADHTVYGTMNGPSEFHIVGSIKTWTVIPDIPKIIVPTLLINGRWDEAGDYAVRPFFEGIPRVRWYTFSECSHTPHLEAREQYIELVSGFLYGQ